MRRLSPREVRRLMQRMGMEVTPLEGVHEVVFKLGDRALIVRDPQVSMIRVAGHTMYQVVGEAIEAPLEGEARGGEVEIPEEDVQLVASQAGVSLEEARRALREAEGDLARAILMLRGRPTS